MKTKKKAKVGIFVTIALAIPIFYVILEYLRNWRHSINVVVGKGRQGW